MKIFLILLGVVSLLLGLIGIALPLLPTTPFLLLSATLFAHSSPGLYSWLLSHKLFGSYIRNYRERRELPKSFKAISIVTLWGTILLSIFTIESNLYIDLLLLVIAIAVTLHIATLGSTKHRDREL